MTIRVFLADDQALVRSGLAMVVASQPDMEVVGEAGDGVEAVHRLTATAADVVLMDVRMPRLDGVGAVRSLMERDHPPKVVMLTSYDLDEHAFAALRAGASGFLLKDTDPEELLEAVRTVARGDAVIAPTTTRRLLDHVAADLPVPTADDPLAALTDREREVLVAVGRGLSNTEIAAELFLGEGTVKTHVWRILTKLDLRDRVQAVVFVYEHRLLRPGQ